MKEINADDFDQFEPLPEPQIIPTPNDPPWNGWTATGVWIASIIAIAVFPAVLLLPYMAQVSGQFADNADMLKFLTTDATAVILQITGVIPAHIATLILAWAVVTNFRKYSFTETLGWRSGGMLWWHYAAIIIGFFVLTGVVSQFVPEHETDLTRILKSSRTAVYIVAFMATFTAPLVEEVIYRGILYSAFQRRFGVPLAVAAVTFIFTAIHIPQYKESISTILLLALLSFILTVVRTKTGNLWPCIVLHTLFNGIQSIMLLLEPYLPKPEAADAPAILLHLLK